MMKAQWPAVSKQLHVKLLIFYSDDIPMREHPKQHFCVWHLLECQSGSVGCAAQMSSTLDR